MKTWIICLLFFLSGKMILAVEREITFRRISPTGGLTSESVTKIVQDDFGYIWLGTNHGLFKYNSKQFEQFDYSREDSTSLPHNIVRDLVVDHQNTLWIATSRGLCSFDRSTRSFIPFQYKYSDERQSKMLVKRMDCDINGNLWLVDDAGFGILNTVSHQLFRLKTLDNEIPLLVYSGSAGNIWMGTRNGSVYKINPNTLAIHRIIKGTGFSVGSIYTDDDKLWIGSSEMGMNLYTRDGKWIKEYRYRDDEGWEFTNETIRKITKDSSGRLWIGTYHGLFIEEQDKLVRFTPDDYAGIPHSSIYDIFEDREKGIWIGTWAGGLSYFHAANNQFFNYSHTKDPQSLSNNIVSSFAQNNAGDFFIGTEVGGLNKFNKEKSTFSVVPLSSEQSHYNIKSQCFDSKGGHWIGTNMNGLWYRASGSKKFKHFKEGEEDGNHVSNRSVYSLFPADSGVWIGTHGGGVNFYHHKTGEISFYDSIFPDGPKQCNPYIKSIFVDSNSNLWFGTVGCLQRIALNYSGPDQKKKSGAIDYYIFSITELSDKRVWIGTRTTGVIIYNIATNTYSYFNAGGLLKGKSVYGVIEDLNGHVWITSNDGLILYKPEEKTSRRFVYSDGIQGNWFSPQAVFKDSDHLLYFGGTNGFSTVSPRNVKFNDRPPVAIISKVSINNRVDRYPFFRSSDTIMNKMQLKPNEKTFKIDFTCDNYLLSEKNRFMYRLVNHYDEWIESDQEATALFVNIPWGEYIFEVKARNNDGVWSKSPARLKFKIAKPFYATNLAFVFYILAFVYLLYYIVGVIKTRAKLRNEIFVEKVLRQQEEQMNEMKLKFFTNISHEFRTPLSLISGPIKTLSKAGNLSEKQADLVNIIQRNSSRLLSLINQVMDLRKIEKGKETLNITSGNLVTFIKDRALNFSNEAERNNIQFIQDYPKDPVIMDFDAEKLDNIIFNLLSNAFKYTSPGGSITLAVSVSELHSDINYSNQLSFGKLSTDEFVSISVTDSGIGIDSDDLLKVFNRFEQGKIHRSSSTGIGLSLCREFALLHHGLIIARSTAGKGSRFIVQLPLKQEGERIFSELQGHYENLSLKKDEIDVPEERPEGTVLVVEDNSDQRKYLEMILSPHFSVKTAENGELGLKILEDSEIDIIVSDVMMPIMDGYEFCTAVKSNISTSHIPVILLTALSSTENKIISMQKGADAYISKPFDDEVLISQVTNLLKQRKKLQELFKPKAFAGPSVELEGLDNYFLKKLDKIIEENLTNEDFSIDLLTQLIDLSRSQLHRKLKSLTNYSTTEYIRIYRLEKSIQLMKSRNYNLDEISFMVGFNTHSYFTTSFKKHYKKSPKEYLKELMKENHGKKEVSD